MTALPDAVHDIRAADPHGVVSALAGPGVRCWAGKGHQSVGGTLRVLHRGRRDTLSAGQRA